jgi:hypothetical protein
VGAIVVPIVVPIVGVLVALSPSPQEFLPLFAFRHGLRRGTDPFRGDLCLDLHGQFFVVSVAGHVFERGGKLALFVLHHFGIGTLTKRSGAGPPHRMGVWAGTRTTTEEQQQKKSSTTHKKEKT